MKHLGDLYYHSTTEFEQIILLMTLPEQDEIKGRGTASNPDARFLENTRERIDDGWLTAESNTKPTTTVVEEKAKRIISSNNSPDIPFTQSINPYRGCEHGCIYCYARPAHAYMDLSPGLDFETRLFYKKNAVELLKRELSAPTYQCSPIALGGNTDAYQPIERGLKVTRQIIELLHETRHPVTIVTKSSLVERDLDLLSSMAKDNLVKVFISITTLNNILMQSMEPRATAPARRLQTLKTLSQAGIPVGVMFAPVIPFINDHEMETVLEQANSAGIESAGYVLLRLPHEIKTLFKQWLQHHYPDKAEHVMSVIRQSRGGKDYDADYRQRLKGTGVFADLIQQRFNKCCARLGIAKGEHIQLNCHSFIKPVLSGQQQQLF